MTGAGRRLKQAAVPAPMATVRSTRTTLVLPAANAYDIELVLQAAESFARRHGASTLDLGRTRIELSCSTETWSSVCVLCGGTARLMAYRLGSHVLCAPCARKSEVS